MSEENKAVRKAPGPMTVWVGKWNDTTNSFEVKEFLQSPTNKELKDTIRKLGPGDWDIITGRTRTVTMETVTTQKFVL